MSDIVINAENLGKKYIIGHQSENGRYTALRDVMIQNVRGFWRKTRDLAQGKPIIQGDALEEVWALKNVNLEIERGEAVGIIGRNGAGKSTLLKVLSRITEPSEGKVTIRGRVASLLEVGTGFHPELTGRENIYLNGAILGMTRAEIKRKFDEIVEFAEVEKYLDTPVKRYSSGMYVRLAFAVAAHLEPEILLVDEVLSVGDVAFQKKCLGRMGTVAKQGRTVLFVSHNLAAIEALCDKSFLLSAGQMDYEGTTSEAIERYLCLSKDLSLIDLASRADRAGNGRLRFTGIHLEDEEGNTIETARSGDNVVFVLSYSADGVPKNVSVSIGVYGLWGQFLLMCHNEMAGNAFPELPEKGEIRCRINSLPFSAGSYSLNIHCEVNGVMSDWIQEACQLVVAEGDFYGTGKGSPASHGGFLVAQSWTYDATT